MKIYISISSYDAIIDASIASVLCKKKIIDHEIFVSLSYSKKDLNINVYKRFFDNINFIDAKEVLTNDNLAKNEVQIRQFYSIYLNLKKAIELNFDFMIVLNSGSWLFDGKSVNYIINKLKDYVIGCRAMKYSNSKRISCDDHFVFVNLKKLKNKNIFVKNFYDLIPFDLRFGGIHTLLNNFFNKFNYLDTLIYSDLTESININNKFPKYLLPLNFDKKFKFLHSNKRDHGILALRYCYLKHYATNCFDETINKEINKWKVTHKAISSENGNFFYEENYFQKFKNFLNSLPKKNFGTLEKII